MDFLSRPVPFVKCRINILSCRAGVGLIFRPGVSCLRPAHFVFGFVLCFLYWPFRCSLCTFYDPFFARIFPTTDFSYSFLFLPLPGESKDNYVSIRVVN